MHSMYFLHDCYGQEWGKPQDLNQLRCANEWLVNKINAKQIIRSKYETIQRPAFIY